MKRFTILVVLAIAGSASANVYLGNEEKATHDCGKDPEVAVAGNDNTITFIGTCTRIAAAGNKNKLTIASVKVLLVPGNKNSVTVDAADAIDVSGNKNTVTWVKGLSDKRPKVSVPGNDNKVGSAK